MALVIVNMDDPRQTNALGKREDAAQQAADLGWRENAYVIIEHADAQFLSNLTGALVHEASGQMEGDTTSARLTLGGDSYEISFSDDQTQIRVTGLESTISVPRDAIDGR